MQTVHRLATTALRPTLIELVAACRRTVWPDKRGSRCKATSLRSRHCFSKPGAKITDTQSASTVATRTAEGARAATTAKNMTAVVLQALMAGHELTQEASQPITNLAWGQPQSFSKATQDVLPSRLRSPQFKYFVQTATPRGCGIATTILLIRHNRIQL